MSLLDIFTQNLLPVLLLAAVGLAVQRLLRLDPRPFSQVVFYIFSPALVFHLLIDVPFRIADMLRMSAVVVALLSILGVSSWLLARLLRLPRTLSSALVLVVTFMNAGNLGLPISRLALGEVSLAWATVFFATTALMANSAGAWVASLGRTSAWRSLLGLARVPAVYAIPLALALRSGNVAVPDVVRIPAEMLADATIPSMLVLLGMQLGRNGRPIRLRLLALVAALRLLVSPAAAWGLMALVPLPVEAARAGILEAAMPSAVLTSILATEYDVEPEFVAGAILVTTALSPLTLSALLLALK